MTQAIAPITNTTPQPPNQSATGQIATNSVQPEVLQAIAKAKAKPEIVWESLPKNFILPDDPVESIAQPLLAAALNDSLEIAQLVTLERIVASNMALVVKSIKRRS